MFYLVHIDHNGGYQGVIKAFCKLKTAKKYLDDRPKEFRRCGMIAVHADSGNYARLIVEIPIRVKKNRYGQYGVDEPYSGEDNEEEKWKRYETWYKTLDEAVEKVADQVSLLSDWDPWD